MVMLENQLPLFVLDRLLELQLDTPNQTGLVAQVAVKFFDPLMPTGEASTRLNPSKLEPWLEESLNSLGDNGDLHCLDVFRRSLLKSNAPNPRSEEDPLQLNLVDKRQQQLVHCVTELREAGVKFKTRKTDRFWDIRFEHGCLEIPKLLIHDGMSQRFCLFISDFLGFIVHSTIHIYVLLFNFFLYPSSTETCYIYFLYYMYFYK